MPKRKNPRHGSMQFWPRVRANRIYPRIRSWASSDKPSLLGFPCYKAGMTHVVGIDNRKSSITKGEEISLPVTILECPPIRILSIRFYKNSNPINEYMFKPSKEVSRKIPLPKKFADTKDLDSIKEFDMVTAIVHTQPKVAGLKKTPEIMELKLGGPAEDQLVFLKDNVGKDIKISDVFEEGGIVDVHAITKGKGTQGPVKRFGVSITNHKSEKIRRGPGSLGGWKGQAHFMYRIAFAGQTGFHQRMEHNKQILMVTDDIEKINPKAGIKHYGDIRTDCLLLAGSTPGPAKRLVILTQPTRSTGKPALPSIETIVK